MILYKNLYLYCSNLKFPAHIFLKRGGLQFKKQEDTNKTSLIQKPYVLKNQKSKGMTLLETLVALGLFAFMFVFLSQVVRQSHRQARKAKKDIHSISSLSNTLNLIRRDFQGIGYLLDINENLNIKFPIQEKNDSLSENEEPIVGTDVKEDLQKTGQRSVFPMLFSPYFVFEGEDEEMKFVSYSFSNSVSNKSSPQWIKIHYSVKDCDSLKGDSSGSCLVRSVNQFWDPRKNEEPEETFILLRDLQSLKFFYSNTEGFLDDNWKERWKLENSLSLQNSSLDYPQKNPFPSVIKMEVEKEDFEQIFFFPVSSSYLKTWNPYDKAYPGFPKWKPPKEREQVSGGTRRTR